jgi:hypothetical protein
MTLTYRVTEHTPDRRTWADPEAYREIVADSVAEAATRYCERADPAWWVDKRRGDPTHIRRISVYVLTPTGDVWTVPIVAGVAAWTYRPCDRRHQHRWRPRA